MAIWAIEELDGKSRAADRLCRRRTPVRGHRIRRRLALRPARAPQGDPLRRGDDDRLSARPALLGASSTEPLLPHLRSSAQSARSAAPSPRRWWPTSLRRSVGPSAYTSVRVAANFGVVIGPPLGAVLLLAAGWNALVHHRVGAVGSRVARGPAAASPPRRLRARGPTGARLVRDDRSRSAVRALSRLGDLRLDRLRRLRDRAPRLARRRLRLRRSDLGLPGLDQPVPGDVLPDPPHASRGPPLPRRS